MDSNELRMNVTRAISTPTDQCPSGTGLTCPAEAAVRAVLRVVYAAIRDEDWWNDNTNDPYTIGDNDGKARCMNLVQSLMPDTEETK